MIGRIRGSTWPLPGFLELPATNAGDRAHGMRSKGLISPMEQNEGQTAVASIVVPAHLRDEVV